MDNDIDMEQEVEVRISSATNFVGSLKTFYVEVMPILESEDWKTWEVADQTELRELIRKGYDAFSKKLRPKLDTAIWAGHKNGTVSTEVQPIRAEGQYTKTPGRKAKTAAEQFDSL